MKLLQFMKKDHTTLGVQTAYGICDLERTAAQFHSEVPTDMIALMESGSFGLNRIRELLEQAEAFHKAAPFFWPASDVHFAPCVTHPEKILCVGLNYKSHAAEAKMEVPETPVLFSKFNNALASHGEQISIPKGAQKIDYEAELVVVMGRKARDVAPDEALSYVFGYTVGNDLSARELQFRTGQWLLGKSLDGFAPVGPYLVTADELANPDELNIECRVNGGLRQSANTNEMIFNCATLISYASQYMTLQPGDILFTGTPEGVIMGYPESEQVWLRPGDEIEVSIERIGTLKNWLR
ncbi:MAG: fumarylacetoacetate hydrolase family protein [Firmicutes bacterium]|nr:fumarylacetoacetate hydrolase family protein [Bacillota bacterium]